MNIMEDSPEAVSGHRCTYNLVLCYIMHYVSHHCEAGESGDGQQTKLMQRTFCFYGGVYGKLADMLVYLIHFPFYKERHKYMVKPVL